MSFFKKYFLVALLLPYSIHSFVGEDFFRWCGRYILSFRIVKWLNIIPQSDVTQLGKTLFDNKNSLKSVPSLDQDFLNILQETNRDNTQVNKYTAKMPRIYSDQYLTLTGFFEILTQFKNHQKQELLHTPWAEQVDKGATINQVHDEHNPTFFVQRVIIPKSAKVYYLSDLHGGIQGILDVLANIDHFDWNTLQLPANTYLCFTGDFVDKGLYGSLCLALSYQLKINNPTNVIITRGNHEDPNFLNIAQPTEKDYLDFGTELYYRYYHSTGIVARLLQFLYPQEHLKNLIRQTYELLPVMAFILHRKSNDNDIGIELDEKKTPDSFVGFVASHAGLDTAYSPHRLLTIKEEASIPNTLYDSYFDPQQEIASIHPQNKEAQQAIEKDLKIACEEIITRSLFNYTEVIKLINQLEYILNTNQPQETKNKCLQKLSEAIQYLPKHINTKKFQKKVSAMAATSKKSTYESFDFILPNSNITENILITNRKNDLNRLRSLATNIHNQLLQTDQKTLHECSNYTIKEKAKCEICFRNALGTLNNYLNQIAQAINNEENLIVADNFSGGLTKIKSIIEQQIQQLKIFEKTLARFADSHPSEFNLSIKEKITFIKNVTTFKMCSLHINKNQINFKKHVFGLSFTTEPFISLQRLVNTYGEFWSKRPQKITDLQCCWSWKTPDLDTPCIYKPATTSINFSISCAVHNALLTDWRRCNPCIHLHHSFQGHIQNGGLFYSTLPQHVDAYKHGCGCAWYPIKHAQNEDNPFIYTKIIPQNSAQVIAPGKDSCYGSGVSDEKYLRYKQDQLDQGLITKESYFPQFKGQKFNPVVHTTFNPTTNSFEENVYKAYPDGSLVYE